MSLELEREKRTRAFRQVGILRCASFLETQNIRIASDQMTVVYGFLSSEEASVGIWDRPQRWMETGLHIAARTWHSGSWKVTWPVVLNGSKGPIEWAPEQEFGNLLSARYGGKAFEMAARRLQQRGIKAEWATLIDLRDDFTALILPKAVHTFDPEKGAGREVFWLSTLFYRYALRSIRSDYARREQLDLFRPVLLGSPTPEEALIEADREASLAAVVSAMDELSVEQRLALRLYFGIGDREWTLQEIGRAVGLNRLKARNLVVHGLARLALASGAGDRLGEVERIFARKLFDEGMSPMNAAREMGVSAADMAARIASAFKGALRARTVPHHGARNQAGGSSMNHFAKAGFAPVVAADEGQYLNALLVALDREPRFEDFGDGVLRVDLGGALFELANVREAVTDATADAMLAKGVPIDWLLSGPARPEPGPLAEELEAVQATRWETASELLDACEERAGTIAVTWDERDLAVRQVCTVLISVSQALDRELPAAALLRGGAQLLVGRMSGEAEPISCWWNTSPPTARLDVVELFRHQAMVAGGFTQAIADIFGTILAERLISAEFVPDGFVYANETDGLVAFNRPWLEMDFD